MQRAAVKVDTGGIVAMPESYCRQAAKRRSRMSAATDEVRKSSPSSVAATESWNSSVAATESRASSVAATESWTSCVAADILLLRFAACVHYYSDISSDTTSVEFLGNPLNI